MFNPPKLKYKKYQKRRFKNKVLDNTKPTLFFGSYGIQVQQKGLLKYSEIEASRRVISKYVKNIGKLWIKISPNIPRTKKPLESRMGKGKGIVNDWVCKIPAGTTIFEISRFPEQDLIKKLKLIQQKISLKTKIITKGK